ncbi:MAG: hypothetical protein N2560_06840 [Ignavibacteria bacterium]|nr:hypothetical protein [Ignavibacteria bacterium]
MKTNKLSVLYLVLIFVFLFLSCEELIDVGFNKEKERINLLSRNFDDLDGLFAGFYAETSYGKISFAEIEDTLLSNKVIEYGPRSSSAAYIGNNLQINYCKINGQVYEEITTEGRTHYNHSNPTVYFDGTPNVFEWSINNIVYYDTMIYNAPLVAITYPHFMEEYSKNQDLIVQWLPSETEDDFIMISIQGNPTITNDMTDTSFKISYYRYITEDNGRFVFPKNILQSFYENKATIYLTRGTYKISYHNGNKYAFTIYSSHRIDIRLR